ncbi:hypothetical protein EBS80_00805 [bacterium]|nr:hypothetical protein [bacterium]
MERQLFDKPLADLREAFVRARFAEPAMFGRADIPKWLADPEWTGIIDFDKSRAFVRSFEEVWENLERDQELARYATPTNKIPDWMLSRVNDKMALEILNAEIKGNRPNANEARAFLNRIARHAVANVRKDAERDFDEAAAVSADGTKIVKAAWVLAANVTPASFTELYPGSALIDEMELFPSAAFAERKALLRPGRGGTRVGLSLKKSEGAIVDRFSSNAPPEMANLGENGSWDYAVFACNDGTDAFPILVIDRNLCPRLPLNGRKIRV